jgi:hypothetical protein
MKILVTASSQKHVPRSIIARLVKKRPQWRDLAARLLAIPLLPRGHFVENLPQEDHALIALAQRNKWSLYYGYKIRVEPTLDFIDTMLFCVDKKGRVVEDTNDRLNNTAIYAAVKVPEADIKSRKYAFNFERMDYVLRNLES